MTAYLEAATNFDGMEIKERHHPWGGENDLVLCPLCDGYGGWNLLIPSNPDSHGRFFRANCHQCNGYGWVDGEDAECIHDFSIELTPAEARARDRVHFGNCYHVYECAKCGRTRSVDSSG